MVGTAAPTARIGVICYYGPACVSEKPAKNYLRIDATPGSCPAGNLHISYEPINPILRLSLQAFPNFVQDTVTREVLAPNTGPATLEGLNLTARARQTRTAELAEGLNRIDLRLYALPKKLYLIQIHNALNQRETMKLSKQ